MNLTGTKRRTPGTIVIMILKLNFMSTVFTAEMPSCKRNLVWLTRRKREDFNGDIIQCKNREDAEALRELIIAKRRGLQAVKTSNLLTNPIMFQFEKDQVKDETIYAEAFDSLNIIEKPPPLPKRSPIKLAPGRPLLSTKC